nr:hypothetical protein [uncultured Rhodopila sp.]
MPFDDTTRGRLQTFTGAARDLLAEEFAWQLQQTYGMDPASGEVAGLDRLVGMDDQRMETARILREIMAHYLGPLANPSAQDRRHVLDRIVREQAFTVLNRLAALRMMEARGILLESVARGYQSKAFQLYQHVAGSALGETGDAYRVFLFSLFDMFAGDLPALFDRHPPFGRLFPREATFLRLLGLINAAELEPLWGEDETIGWIYQYFNPDDERRRMRRESDAPRNSRELAVRNQFFTPRYVVEFLVDNTLARQWIDMTGGRTALADQCRFLVRRLDEVFLGPMSEDQSCSSAAIARILLAQEYDRLPNFGDPLTGVQATVDFAYCVNAYGRFPDAAGAYFAGLMPILREQRFDEATTQQLWDGLFLECRSDRYCAEGEDGKVFREPWFRATCEEILRRLKAPKSETVLNRYRAVRDPRTLKLLDPACGSMHFGLYAFDVFLQIYREAWDLEDENGFDAFRSPEDDLSDLPPLHDLYQDEDAFLRDVPRLILDYNIYGVDIDPRATQIASLALWLRAQRVWHEAEVPRDERPDVGRGHIVAAVAPPAEADLRRELMGMMAPLDAELFEQTLFLLNGLPEFGVLLRAEREVPALVRQIFGSRGPIFEAEDEQQWQRAEKRLRDALEDFARAAAGSYRERLFTDDALEGLRLIDLVRMTFDVIVMNPPFGIPSIGVKGELEKSYPKSKNDVLSVFVERGVELLRYGGRLGAITSRNCFFQPSARKWREDVILSRSPPVNVADLGFGVMDEALVESAAYILQKGYVGPSIWYRLVSETEKSDVLAAGGNAYKINNSSFFSRLPMTPFVYWMPNSFIRLFELSEKFECSDRSARCGMGTLDDFRFVRNWWEVQDQTLWTPYAKGGDLSAFVTDMPAIVNFRNGGREVKIFVEAKVGSASRKIQAESFYFRKGIQYGRRIRDPSPAILPAGSIFSDSANGVFIANDSDENLLAYLGILNSDAVKAVLTSLAPVRKMEVGYLQSFPVPLVSSADIDLVEYARSAARASICRIATMETSRYFVTPFLPIGTKKLGKRNIGDSKFFIPPQDIAFLREQSQVLKPREDTYDSDVGDDDDDDDDDDEEEEEGKQSLEDQTSREWAALSWAVGIAFGRFDIRLGSGERELPVEPNPFDPLPEKSPGMLSNGDAPFHANDGILSDDLGATHDLPNLINSVLDYIGKEIAAEAREWLRRRFFLFHLRQYTKSRRKAPIYWPLSTASGSYTLWLYYPALTDQTLFIAANDFVGTKLDQQVEPALRTLRQKTGRSRQEEQELGTLQTLHDELRALRDELLRLAPGWKPNHDDGVQITAAPLWRLFRHRPWQTLLRDTWEKLERGGYDWSHLAMSYWPARVWDKCRTDRSLAIAHDLEHLYEPPPEPEAAPKRGRKKKG